jgi:hypothetical protein
MGLHSDPSLRSGLLAKVPGLKQVLVSGNAYLLYQRAVMVNVFTKCTLVRHKTLTITENQDYFTNSTNFLFDLKQKKIIMLKIFVHI